MSYQGWANWETWNTWLWIGNEERLYRAACAEARLLPKGKVTRKDAERIVRHLMPAGTPDMPKRRSAGKLYAEVDWQEIANSLEELQ